MAIRDPYPSRDPTLTRHVTPPLLLLGQVLTMAAAMGFRSPFFCPIDKREEADKARKAFATGHSDLLTTLRAFDGWQARGGWGGAGWWVGGGRMVVGACLT